MFSVLYRHWIWIGPLFVGAGIIALVVLIHGLVIMVRASVLVRVPLAESQEVRFEEAGTVSLAVEGPPLTTRFARVSFDLTSLAGESVPGHIVLFRTRSSGVRKARLEVRRFDIPEPGTYVLRMNGLGAPRDRDSAHGVVFTRPFRTQLVTHILGIVAASLVLIGSLVFFLMRLVGGSRIS